MNKLTSTLAGLALVATVSIAPAMAQTTAGGGNFTNLGVPFTFFDNGTTVTFNSATPVTFNPFNSGNPEVGTLSLTLTGGNGSANTGQQFFSGVNLTFTSVGNPTIVDNTFANGALVSFIPGGPFAGQAQLSSVGKSTLNDSFELTPGTPVVPEASTTISFGALLALGGLAVVLRRKGVKNAA